jgi:hypothetical protein
MEMKKEIAEILYKELSYVYCHNCDSRDLSEDDDDYGCEECYRKQMGWSLRKSTAEKLAGNILERIEK